MNIVKDGHPFIFAFAIITFAVGYWGSLIWAVVPAVLMLFGKAPCAFLMFHFIFSVSIKQAVPCGRLAAPCYFSALYRKSQHSPARYSKYPQKYA